MSVIFSFIWTLYLKQTNIFWCFCRLNFENGLFSNHWTKNEVFHYRCLQQMWLNPQFPEDLVTFTEEILNGELHFFRSDQIYSQFIVVLDDIICFSVRFCDNLLFMLKMRFQAFIFASKKVQGFSSEERY